MVETRHIAVAIERRSNEIGRHLAFRITRDNRHLLLLQAPTSASFGISFVDDDSDVGIVAHLP